MGEDIVHDKFDSEDFERFRARVGEETQLAQALFDAGGFSETGYALGFEIEAWLLDHSYYPNPDNAHVLAALKHPLVVPELSRFNVEFNCTPVAMGGDAFSRVRGEFQALLDHCNAIAHGMDSNIMMIGTLPTVRDEDLTLPNLSPVKRYHALNNEVLRQRRGQPIKIDIEGHEHLTAVHRDVTLEAATTSFQIHLKTPAHLAHRYYNASLLASAPILAAAANAPFLFGRDLWDETRIPLFEQAIALDSLHGRAPRVGFGSGLLRRSLLEAFVENFEEYPSLLPMSFDEPPEAMRHLRLHNGTIWRWNRPLVGFEPGGTPHLRIEHRALPAGPTLVDMMANAALYCGLIHALVQSGEDERLGLSFETARENFYAAARFGLEAELAWPTVRVPARDLLVDMALPMARQGLSAFGIDEEDRDLLLDIIEARVRSGQTGAVWQRRAFETTRDFLAMTALYCERQRAGTAVHEWEI